MIAGYATEDTVWICRTTLKKTLIKIRNDKNQYLGVIIVGNQYLGDNNQTEDNRYLENADGSVLKTLTKNAILKRNQNIG